MYFIKSLSEILIFPSKSAILTLKGDGTLEASRLADVLDAMKSLFF